MATWFPDGWLSFTYDSGGLPSGVMDPTSTFTYFDNSGPQNVLIDYAGDGNADTFDTFPDSDFFAGNIFSGFTVEISGEPYAVFGTSGIAFVPFFNSLQDLSGLDGTSVPLPITNAGTDAPAVNMCLLVGTRITTPSGEVAVEDLHPGAIVTTADGRSVPITWIGRQTISTRFGPAERLTPVRVQAGALGHGLPTRDLTLTADHALVIEGLLVNAGALVNGTSITHVPLSEFGDSYTVCHVETERHDVILAEGAPAETYIDYVGRQAFDNYAEFVALVGYDRIIAENPAPRISSARQLPASIAARLGIVRAA